MTARGTERNTGGSDVSNGTTTTTPKPTTSTTPKPTTSTTTTPTPPPPDPMTSADTAPKENQRTTAPPEPTTTTDPNREVFAFAPALEVSSQSAPLEVKTYTTRDVDNANTYTRHFDGGDAANVAQPAFVVVEVDPPKG